MLKRSGKTKDQHAVALGRRGGLVGGKARAASLSPSRRREIAIDAARARWQKPVRETSAPTRNASRTRNRILDAARREFIRRGVDAGRLDRIAAAAGVNRRMIYYYFGSKGGLFREMLARNILRIGALEQEAGAETAGEDLVRWQNILAAHPHWIRLSMWEALGDAGRPYAAEEERRTFWEAAVAGLSSAQSRGEMATLGDAAQLQLTIIATVMFPLILPQMAHLVTGLDPSSSQFRARRADHLHALGDLLQGVEKTAD